MEEHFLPSSCWNAGYLDPVFHILSWFSVLADSPCMYISLLNCLFCSLACFCTFSRPVPTWNKVLQKLFPLVHLTIESENMERWVWLAPDGKKWVLWSDWFRNRLCAGVGKPAARPEHDVCEKTRWCLYGNLINTMTPVTNPMMWRKWKVVNITCTAVRTPWEH